MMNINLLLDSWDDPTKDLYLKETEVLTSGICLRYLEKEKFRKILRSIFYINGGMLKKSLMDELHGYMNLNICSDESIHFELYNKNSLLKQVCETHLFNSVEEMIEYILNLPTKHQLKDEEVLIKIYISKGNKRLEFESRSTFIDCNEFFKKHILANFPERLSPFARKVFNRYIKNKNLFELTAFLDSYNKNSEEFVMTDNLVKQLDKLLQNKLKEIYNSMEMKREYLNELQNSTLILDTSCIA